MQTFEGQVANDRQLFNFENDVHAAAWTVFSQHTSGGLIEECQRQERLVIALYLINVVRISRSSLDVIKNIVLTQATITDDVDAFDESLLLGLLFFSIAASEVCGLLFSILVAGEGEEEGGE